MKKWMLIMLACLIAGNVAYSDEIYGEKTEKIAKEDKKALKKRLETVKDSIDHEFAVDAMRDGYYVLMAERMIARGHAYLNPQSNTNFLLVQGDKATIQIASNSANPGLNGLGGITVEGNISGLSGGEPDKKGNISYSFTITGPAVSAQVQVTLYKDDNYAMAIISPNFWAGTLTIYGDIAPYKNGEYEKAIKGEKL